MWFEDVPREVALALRDETEAAQKFRLADLAIWLDRSNGPIGSLDASTESLDILWEWFLEFASNGLNGVPDDARPRWADLVGREEDQPRNIMREGWAAERICAYVFLVVQRVDPTARWGILERRKRGAQLLHAHSTGVLLANGEFFNLTNVLRIMTNRRLHEPPTASEVQGHATELSRVVTLYTGGTAAGAGRPVLQKYRGHPTSESLPNYPRDGAFDISQWAARNLSSACPISSERQLTGGEDFVIAMRGAPENSDFDLFPILPHAELAKALRLAGFVGDAGPELTDDALVEGEVSLEHEDSIALVELNVVEGELRSLTFENGVPSSKAKWDRMLKPLRSWANSVGAQLTSSMSA